MILEESKTRLGGAIAGAYQAEAKCQLICNRVSRIGVDVVFVLNTAKESFILSFTICETNPGLKLRAVTNE